MVWRALSVSFASLLLVACNTPPPAPPPAAAPAPAAGEQGKPAGKSEEELAKEREAKKKQQAKDLRTKQRELASFLTEQQVAVLERTSRQLGIDATLAKTASQLETVRQELSTFLAEVKPREIEEHKIRLDQSIYYAEHQKDELGELTAMYEADEFARSTKELVLKRGRRELEMAERRLAVARKESAHFETVALPQRERELKQKVADAELDRRKAELDGEKAKIEFALAVRKAQEKQADLEEDIAELQEAMTKEATKEKS